MAKKRPYVLSIAGFDPSAGAGVLSDIKTFEQNKVYGLGVSSSITFQNEDNYMGTRWVLLDEIIAQLSPLVSKYKIDFIKIGLIQNWEVLWEVLEYLYAQNPKVKIVLDPIVKASAANEIFHTASDIDTFMDILPKIFMITPNWEEMKFLFPDSEPEDSAILVSKFCHVYLKGGHRPTKKGYDTLFIKGGGESFSFRPKHVHLYPKHGSGCILSSALTANLAKGFPLLKTCLRSKSYVESVMKSNSSLLGWHER